MNIRPLSCLSLLASGFCLEGANLNRTSGRADLDWFSQHLAAGKSVILYSRAAAGEKTSKSCQASPTKILWRFPHPYLSLIFNKMLSGLDFSLNMNPDFSGEFWDVHGKESTAYCPGVISISLRIRYEIQS